MRVSSMLQDHGLNQATDAAFAYYGVMFRYKLFYGFKISLVIVTTFIVHMSTGKFSIQISDLGVFEAIAFVFALFEVCVVM